MTLDELAKLNEGQLSTWLLARLKGESSDPPIAEMHGELPTTLVEHAIDHGDSGLQRRLRTIVAQLITELVGREAHFDVKTADALGFLCDLAGFFEIAEAGPPVRRLIERGRLEQLDPSMLAAAYAAFATLQVRDTYSAREFWLPLWRDGAPKFWPVATAGLRYSDSELACEILPEIVSRACALAIYPLGETVDVYLNDPGIVRILRQKGSPLSNEEFEICVAHARPFGVAEERLALLRPPVARAARAAELPAWASHGSTTLPHLRMAA